MSTTWRGSNSAMGLATRSRANSATASSTTAASRWCWPPAAGRRSSISSTTTSGTPTTDGNGPTLVILNPLSSLEMDPVTGQSASWSRANSCVRARIHTARPESPILPRAKRPRPIPTGVTASSPLWSQASLNWNDTTGETGFLIERKTGTAGDWSQVAEVAADVTTYLDQNLTAGHSVFLPRPRVQRCRPIARHQSGQRDHGASAAARRAVEPDAPDRRRLGRLILLGPTTRPKKSRLRWSESSVSAACGAWLPRLT